jgi:hypothetical protein
MANFPVDKKIAYVRRIGPTLTLSVSNLPQLVNILKITGLTGPGQGGNARTSYTGAYAGRTPGGTLQRVVQGEVYELNAGLFDGSYALPDFVEVTVPTITGLNPLAVAQGGPLIILGTNLKWTKYVIVGGVAVAAGGIAATDTTISVTVPLTAQVGSNIPVRVVNETGTATLSTLTVTAADEPVETAGEERPAVLQYGGYNPETGEFMVLRDSSLPDDGVYRIFLDPLPEEVPEEIEDTSSYANATYANATYLNL